MRHCRCALEQAGHSVSYTIHEADFLLSNSHVLGQQSLFDRGLALGDFDLVIMNPPYFKIAKGSQYARMMDRVVHGQPNIYALFMALAAEMLRPGGEMVAITPRSFCNGPYFRGFRRWFFDKMSMRHIHLFESRTDTFRRAGVLQESVISLSQRDASAAKTIAISRSFGRDVPHSPAAHQMAANKVVDDTCGDMIIRIPESQQDARIMEFIDAWPRRFLHQGLRVSTGPVVMFRAKQFLLAALEDQEAVPLLSVHNVRPFETVWPVHKKNKPIAFRVCSDSLRLLLPAKNYILLRRFSTKEERRRLTASCFLGDSQKQPYVALENHLNYVYHADRELTRDEVYGVAALFNSALLDRYFRAISGNTQVNATELRTMPFPKLKSLARIGRRLREDQDLGPSQIERIVLDELGVNGTLREYLKEFAL